MCDIHVILFFFFFNDTATTEIYTLSLHDALPISYHSEGDAGPLFSRGSVPQFELARTRKRLLDIATRRGQGLAVRGDRKSTRLNSSHQIISYAVFCLKKKKNIYLQLPKSTSFNLI